MLILKRRHFLLGTRHLNVKRMSKRAPISLALHCPKAHSSTIPLFQHFKGLLFRINRGVEGGSEQIEAECVWDGLVVGLLGGVDPVVVDGS